MIKLGDQVKDLVSGFKGIAMAEHRYLNGCSRWTVQPPVGKDDKLPDEASFDEPQLKVLKTKKVEEDDHSTGGPEKFMDKGR